MRATGNILIRVLVLLLVFGLTLREAFGDARSPEPDIEDRTCELLPYQALDYRYHVIEGRTLPLEDFPTSRRVSDLPPELLGDLQGFEQPSFNDAAFLMDDAPFGGGKVGAGGGRDCPLRGTVETSWPLLSQLLVRRMVDIPAGATDVRMMVSVDNDILGVFFNGIPLPEHTLRDEIIPHEECPIRDEFRFDVPPALVARPGRHLVAFHVQDRPPLGPANESFFDARILAELTMRPLNTWCAVPDPVREISGAAVTTIESPTTPTNLADRSVLVTDEDAIHLYDYNFAANTVTALPFTSPEGADGIDDLEGLTYHPQERSYFMTASLSRTFNRQTNRCEEPEDERLRLGSFRLVTDGTGNLRVSFYTFRGRVEDSLRDELINLLPFGPVQEAARVNHPEQGGLNVEALAFVPAAATPPDINQDALLLGLRGPLAGPPAPTVGCPIPPGGDLGQGHAFYFYLLNPGNYLAGDPPLLRGPFTLYLNNQGFRDATLITIPGLGPRLLVIAGNVEGGEIRPNRPGAYLFDPRNPSMPPMQIPLPPEAEGRAIEAAAALMVRGGERLTLYEDKGGGERSQAVITALPQ